METKNKSPKGPMLPTFYNPKFPITETPESSLSLSLKWGGKVFIHNYLAFAIEYNMDLQLTLPELWDLKLRPT
ncbi:hypothetical protein CCACVL1_07439, partial [Corchorus capsularis]